MRLKKALSVVISGMMTACFAVSGLSFAPAAVISAEETTQEPGSYQNPVYDAATDQTTWDYVYFGTYPQDEVKGDMLTDAIKNAEYDADGIAVVDGIKYKRLDSYSATYAHQFGSDADKPVTEGEFFQWEKRNEYHYFKFKPIKWRVLENKDNQLMLMADQAIDCKPYMPREHKTTWNITEMRSWMNEYDASQNEPKVDYSRGGFLSLAFTEEEKASIIATEVLTEDNHMWGGTVNGMPSGTIVTDKVYILSAAEATNPAYGFAPDEETTSSTRQLTMSDYAFANGGWAGPAGEDQGNCWWLLRTPGDHERKTSVCYRDGRVYMEGYYTNLSPYFCVAPVCRVPADSQYITKSPMDEPDDNNQPTASPEPVPSETPVTPEAVTFGDVDHSGNVDLTDAQLVLKMALKITPVGDVLKEADVDGTGSVDLTDAQLVLKKALKIISKFPVEEQPQTSGAPQTSETPQESGTPQTSETPVTPSAMPSSEPLVQPDDNASGTVWIAADSIAADHGAKPEDPNKRATLGWGVIFDRYFTDDVTIQNTALSSRSSKSYTQEANYKTIMDNMKAGDYLMISFGHNDEFPSMLRYTDPYASSSTEGSYKWYLKNYYIDPTIKKGAIPILVSSVVERNFINGEFQYQFHSVYRKAMEELVAEYAEQGITIPYIDLHGKMEALYKELGDDETKLLHAVYQSKDSDNNLIEVIDNTHFTLAGARYAAKYILEGLKANNMDIMKYANQEMIDTLDSIATPEEFNIGDLDEWIVKGKETAGE